jgi:hypothetical protein
MESGLTGDSVSFRRSTVQTAKNDPPARRPPVYDLLGNCFSA